MTRRLVGLALLVVLVLPGAAIATDDQAPPISLVPVEDPLYGISTVVPDGWSAVGSGVYTRGTPPDDLAVLLMQTTPASNDDLWPALLPQVGQSEVPEQTGTLTTDAADWSLYAFGLDLPSGLSIAIEVALAEDDDRSSLVILQADPTEFAALRDAVLIPALEAWAPLAPEPTADPATLGYVAEEVRFAGGADDVELAGTLTIPRGEGPHPAVVLMSGSGLQDRDESLPGIATLRPFALIADALSSAGIAVLRYDDRGAGESTGAARLETVLETSEDGAAAFEYLLSRPEVDPARVGLLGHSEGGIYAIDNAARDSRIAFVVLLAAPAVDGVSLLQEQSVALARSAGEQEDDIEAVATFAEAALPAARDRDDAAVEAASRELFGTIWDNQSEDTQAALGPRDAFIDGRAEVQLPVLTSDWYRSILAYDPRADLEAVTVPMLAIYGGLDQQVVTAQNEPAFREAVSASGNPDATAVILPDANHLFQAAETGAFVEYGRLADEFTADFLPTLVEWVTERAGVDG